MIRGLDCRIERASASWVRVCRERRQGGMGGGQWYQPSLQLAQKYTHKQICVGDTHTHTHSRPLALSFTHTWHTAQSLRCEHTVRGCSAARATPHGRATAHKKRRAAIPAPAANRKTRLPGHGAPLRRPRRPRVFVPARPRPPNAHAHTPHARGAAR